MNVCMRTVAVALAVLLAPLAAQAQDVAFADDTRAGVISAGAFAGGEMDTPDDWLLFGGDARLGLGELRMELNPRLSYHPVEDGSIFQIDLNMLKNFDLARPGKVRPFVGAGGAIRRNSSDVEGASESKLGVNLITGLRLAMRSGSGYEPFFQAQYTILNDQDDALSVVAGVSFSLR